MYRIILFLCVCCFTGCKPTNYDSKPEKSVAEIRRFQTRFFPARDVSLVMKSILNVLQDDHYIVKNLALDLGFLVAAKESDIAEVRNQTWAHLVSGSDARWPKYEVIEAMVNVREVGQKIRVRLNFQSKVVDNMGMAIKTGPVLDEKMYDDFFEKIEKELS